MTTVEFTPEDSREFQEWLDEHVDYDLLGNPITRRSTLDDTSISYLEFGWTAKASWDRRKAQSS